MKKSVVVLLVILMAFCCIGQSLAAAYTLPEKLHNQLAIGSGLKGTFTITAEGEPADSPFLKAITDAEFSLRGMVSEHDLHYYIFQADANENQTGKTELYRKDGIYYLRSDMVQGTVLAFPTWEQYADTLFPAKGQNPTFTSALINYLSLTAAERENKWQSTWKKYQNQLEMWLANFTMQAEVTQRDDGSTALNFSYEIPGDAIRTRILNLFEAYGSDADLLTQLDTVMTPEQKALYVNGQLGYYYSDLLDRMDWSRPVILNKQVSYLGEVYSSSLQFPLDQKLTGYSTLYIEDENGNTTYKMKSDSAVLSLTLPDFGDQPQDFQGTMYFKRLSSDNTKDGWEGNLSLRADITKNMKLYDDEEERSHQEEQYHIVITALEDDETAAFSLPPFEQAEFDLTLHYYSKYAQNSATTMEIDANWQQGSYRLHANGSFKTAAPWLFMPFDITNAIQVGATGNEVVLAAYLADWISNAPSILHYKQDNVIPVDETIPPAPTEAPTPVPIDDTENDAETVPLEVEEETMTGETPSEETDESGD